MGQVTITDENKAKVESLTHAILAFGAANKQFLFHVERLLGTADLTVTHTLQGEPLAHHLLRRSLHRKLHLFTEHTLTSIETRHHAAAALTVWKRELKVAREPKQRALGWGLVSLVRDSLTFEAPKAAQLSATATRSAHALIEAFDHTLVRHYPTTMAGQQQAWEDKWAAAHHEAQRVPVYDTETSGQYAKQLGMALHQGLWQAAAHPLQVAVLWQPGSTGRRRLWELLDCLSEAHDDRAWSAVIDGYGLPSKARWPLPEDWANQLDPVLDRGAANSVAHLAGVSRLDLDLVAKLPWDPQFPVSAAVQARMEARPPQELAALRAARSQTAPAPATSSVRRRMRS